VFQWRTPVSHSRFSWEAGHEYHIQELDLKAGDPGKGYILKGQEVVKLNLSHTDLPLYSGVSFQL
jgi:hypothetical protein